MHDGNLTETERELARVTILVGEVINSATGSRIWTEDIIPPMSEDDVLSSTLYPVHGEEAPKSGFTLWVDDKAYRVTFEQHK